jgi:hypothetical protein
METPLDRTHSLPPSLFPRFSLSFSLSLSLSEYILYSSHMNLYHITSADHLTTMIHERQGIGMVMLEVMTLSLTLYHLKGLT